MPRVLVYVACSLDGFIAGPDHDLSWLEEAATRLQEQPDAPGLPRALDFGTFLQGIGCLLMGRSTFDVVQSLPVLWPYGNLPVLVATHRPLGDAPPTVRAETGDIVELLRLARERAGDKDIYLDGGDLIRQALDEGLVDELVITTIPVVLGPGRPLFAGLRKRRWFRYGPVSFLDGRYVQLVLRPARAELEAEGDAGEGE